MLRQNHNYLFIFFIFLLISCSNTRQEVDKPSFPDGKWIDLTYSFNQNTVYWPTSEDFQLDTVGYGQSEEGFFYSAFKFSAAEHGGTHLDAPIHFADGKKAVDDIDIEQLIGYAVVIDVSSKALDDPDYLVSIEDLEQWENNHGKISEDDIVLIRTGYGKFWPDKNEYMGTAEKGSEAVSDLHFPGIHPEAAEWLASRNIKAIGIDTPSIDYGQSSTYESHQIFYKNNIPGFENVANLDLLPAKGTIVIALPMKIEGGSGAPLRIIAWLPV